MMIVTACYNIMMAVREHHFFLCKFGNKGKFFLLFQVSWEKEVPIPLCKFYHRGLNNKHLTNLAAKKGKLPYNFKYLLQTSIS